MRLCEDRFCATNLYNLLPSQSSRNRYGAHPSRLIAGHCGPFRTSKTTLEGHRAKCIAAYMAKAKDVVDTQSATALVAELAKITRLSKQLVSRAIKNSDFYLATQLMARPEKMGGGLHRSRGSGAAVPRSAPLGSAQHETRWRARQGGHGDQRP